MKSTRKPLIAFILGIFLLGSANAQLDELDFLKGGVDDAEILFTEYLTPWGNAFGANLNAGWYNTAKPHKLGGFDVTITVNAAWAPSSAKTMDLSELGLDATIIPGANGTITPTIAGDKVDDRPSLLYQADNPLDPGNPLTIAEYEVPNGTELNIIPVPMAQASIGLPFGTEITGRFLPSLNIGNYGNIGLWGVGLKHDIFQHIPVLKKMPVLNASIQGGYTKLRSFANVNFYPEAYEPFAVDLVNNDLLFKGQKLNLDAQAYTINLLLSQNLPVISFYQGIGYSTSNTSVSLTGLYPFTRIDETTGQVVIDESDECLIEDPIDMEIYNTRDLRLNIGFRIKLGVLTIHADYTKANYSMATAGIGISFR